MKKTSVLVSLIATLASTLVNASGPELYKRDTALIPFANTLTAQSSKDLSGVELSPYIIHGTSANADDYSFHARIVETYGSWGYFDICGGTILSDRWILTAAHCVADNITGDMLLGEDNGGILLKNFSRYNVFQEEIKKIKSIHVHPMYTTDSYFYADIALIELAVPIKDNVASMRIPSMIDKSKYDLETLGTIIGMGYINDGSQVPDTLQENKDVALRTHAECESFIGSGLNYDEVMCTSGTNRTCSGDSGGSLLYTDPDSGALQQIGITSYGYFLCEYDSYSVFTEVAYFEAWIDSIIDGNALVFNPSDEHNDYHSYGDNNFIYSEQCFECGDETVESSTSSGGGTVNLLVLIGLGLLGLFRRQKQFTE